MAINALVQQLCGEDEVGIIYMWGYFVGRADQFMRDGLHLSAKGAAVLQWTVAWVAYIIYIRSAVFLEVHQIGKEASNTQKAATKYMKTFLKLDLNAYA